MCCKISAGNSLLKFIMKGVLDEEEKFTVHTPKKASYFVSFHGFSNSDHASMAAKYFISSFFLPCLSANCRNESEKSPK